MTDANGPAARESATLQMLRDALGDQSLQAGLKSATSRPSGSKPRGDLDPQVVATTAGNVTWAGRHYELDQLPRVSARTMTQAYSDWAARTDDKAARKLASKQAYWRAIRAAASARSDTGWFMQRLVAMSTSISVKQLWETAAELTNPATRAVVVSMIETGGVHPGDWNYS